MAQHPDAGKQRRWLALIRLWQHSKPKVTVREFCQRHSLSEASFFAWRRTLRTRGLIDNPQPSQLSKPTLLPNTAAFLQLTPVAEPVTPTAIDLLLNGQRLLRVRPGFDGPTLLQLVRLLEELAC